MKIIPYGRQCISDYDKQAVLDVLSSEYITQGPVVEEFENSFAEYVGAEYAVAVANGTAALHLSAMALGVSPNSKVITTPITFAASANCIGYCGGEIVFADIDTDTYLLDINKVEELICKEPKGTYEGIIPVDFAGQPVNMELYRKLADKHGLWIIEDACHAPGGYFMDTSGKMQLCGNGQFADLSIFSFHPVKHIATGEGGMVTTNSKLLYDKLCLLRSHGITRDPELLIDNHGGWYYEMQEIGYNYRLSDIHSALGVSQLKAARKNICRRSEIAEKYDAGLKGTHYVLPYRQSENYHAFHLYVILTDKRKELYYYLRELGIYTQVHYIPVHLQPYYKNLGWKQGDFSIAENYYSKCLSLPMYPSLMDKEIDYVIESLLNFEIKHFSR